MTLREADPVEVQQVANGYVVMPALGGGGPIALSDQDRLVFQTFAELVAWMSQHFTHRATDLVVDRPQTDKAPDEKPRASAASESYGNVTHGG